MAASGVAPDLLSYTTVATAYLRADRPADALETIRRLRAAYRAAAGPRAAKKLRPNVVAYTIACSAKAKTGDLAGARATVAEMRANGVAPNARTCAALLEASLAAGAPGEGAALAAEMEKAGVARDVVTATLLLRCRFAAGDPAGAEALLAAMEAPGSAVRPNLVTYNAAVAGFERAGDRAAALDALGRLADRFAPNKGTWAALLAGRDDDADWLYAALAKLAARGRAVPGAVYEAWLLRAAKAGALDRAAALARDRAAGRLRVAASSRRRANDAGERLDAPARLDQLERTLLMNAGHLAADPALPGDA